MVRIRDEYSRRYQNVILNLNGQARIALEIVQDRAVRSDFDFCLTAGGFGS
jgi:hypothetical protein